jgi:putative flippase GtrA
MPDQNPQSRIANGLKQTFVTKTNKLLPQFLRYIWVGALTTIIDVAILNTMTFGFGINERISAATGYMVGVAVNYFICIVWIFPSQKGSRVKEFLLSMTVGLIGMLMNDMIIKGGCAWLPTLDWLKSLIESFGIKGNTPQAAFYLNFSKAVSTVTVLAWNFLTRKYLIFRNSKAK